MFGLTTVTTCTQDPLEHMQCPETFDSVEEASKLLAKASAHERSSQTLRDFTALQAEIAISEAERAEKQLQVAETHVNRIIQAIGMSGFKVEFGDCCSRAIAVIDLQDTIYTVSVEGSRAISLNLD